MALLVLLVLTELAVRRERMGAVEQQEQAEVQEHLVLRVPLEEMVLWDYRVFLVHLVVLVNQDHLEVVELLVLLVPLEQAERLVVPERLE